MRFVATKTPEQLELLDAYAIKLNCQQMAVINAIRLQSPLKHLHWPMLSRTTFVQSNLPVIRNMQRMAPDDYYDRIERWSSSARYAREIEALLHRLDLPNGADLLDVGCGAGTAMRFASRCGLRVVGLDRPAPWEVRCSVRPIVRADAARLPFRCASFDGVLLFHVLAHLFAPEICLSDIHRVPAEGRANCYLHPQCRVPRHPEGDLHRPIALRPRPHRLPPLHGSAGEDASLDLWIPSALRFDFRPLPQRCRPRIARRASVLHSRAQRR